MPGQPRTMEELTASIMRTSDRMPDAVIPTIATRTVMDLRQYNSSQHTAATAYQAHALALGNGIGNQRPGIDPIHLTAQTDIYYMGGDHTGQFSRMVSIVVAVGRRTR